ncbi:AbrB/MazE/SpoVT family DNA-binding domain-containing protein [Dyella humicola]|uniref:AbrB/MazE/SpoVT family DNA-binding domain-containing protein n=1 Tax=Dyella humicola TaxID=2992126 RepID=UPI00225AAC5D|nr:AbrB/MazE/SpoVT family DNA-binding domain-containing protein [Dyella humicola]
MKAKMKLAGGGATVTLPASVISAAGFRPGAEVEIHVENGRVALTQRGSDALLDRLLEGITPANIHREVDTGGPLGNEAL